MPGMMTMTLFLIGLLALCLLPWRAKGRLAALMLGVLVLMVQVLGMAHMPPGYLSLPGSLWLMATGVLAGALLAFMPRWPQGWRVSLLAMPLALVYALLALLAQLKGSDVHVLQAVWLRVHIWAGIAAASVFTLAASSAALVLTRIGYLKARATSAFSRLLPGLEDAEALQTFYMALGALFLLVALLAGGLARQQLGESFWGHDGKSLLTYGVFAWVLALLAAHQAFGQRGRRAAQGVWFVCLAVWVLYFVAQVMPFLS